MAGVSQQAMMGSYGAQILVPAAWEYGGLQFANGVAEIPAGADAADRRIFVMLNASRNGALTLNSALINATPATIHVQHSAIYSGSTRMSLALISALIPTGSSVTVTPTYDNTPTNPVGHTYRVTGLNSSIARSTVAETRSGSSFSVNMDVLEGGISFAAIYSNGSASRVLTTAQMTKTYENGAGGAVKYLQWAANENATNASKLFSWSTSPSGINDGPFIAATFR